MKEVGEYLSHFFDDFIQKLAFGVEQLELSSDFGLLVFAEVEGSFKFFLILTGDAFVVKL